MSRTLEMQGVASAAYRLSPQQARLWLSWPDGRAVFAQCAVLLEGGLRADLLRGALRLVSGRHEILRTVFQDVPGMKVPVQVVAPDGEFAWREVVLGGADGPPADGEVEGLCRDEIARAAAREAGGRLGAVLALCGPARHLLVLTLPTLCADAASLGNLLREVAAAYGELCGGAVGEPEEEAVQYVQFSEWQNELLEDEASDGRAWWRQRREAARGGEGVEAAPVLPLEGEHFAGETPAGDATARGRVGRRLDAAEAAALERLAGAEGASVWLLACWQVLLQRLSGRTRFPLRVSCGGRVYEEMRGALGLYAKWPRVHVHVEGEFSFREVSARARAAVAEAEEWQEHYFAEDEGAPATPDAAAQDVGFEFDAWPGSLEAAGVRFTLLRRRANAERLKLKLSCASAPEFTAFELDYDPSVYDAGAAGRLADQYLTLLRGLLRDPDAKVKDAPLPGEAERRRLLYEWNDTRVAGLPEACLHELFEAQAARTPDRAAVVFGDQALSYRELDERANRLARRLQEAGVGPESRVAICLERSAELLVAVFAVLKAGGAYLPLDPAQPAHRLALILEDAGAAAALTEERLRERLAGGRAEVICLDSEAEAIARRSAQKPYSAAGPGNTVYVIYTSGSTGVPKGVGVCHRSAVNLAAALGRAVYAGRPAPLRVSLNAPLAFDSSVKQVVQLLAGHTLYVVPEEVRPDGAALLQFIRLHGLDVLDCTPSQLRLLLDAGLGGGGAPALALVGGEAIEGPLWEALCAHPETAFYNVYGPTECTVDATACRVKPAPRPHIGRPLSNVQVYVLDGALRPAPVGVAGEIYIGGEGVARGYVNRPGLTAEKFIPHPFSAEPGARLYRTGDRGRFLPGGELECVGRVDNQVKLRGYRVELGEIEAVLAGHEAVRDAVAVVREDEPGARRLVAYVVPARDGAAQLAGLRDYLREKLPEYMLPSAVVALKALPLTRNGKVDRAGLPAPDGAGADDHFVAPRTPAEEVVAGIWAQLFRLRRVSAQANFFELGGHSLLATQVISRVRQAFGVEVPVRALFESPTVAALAARAEAETKAGRPRRPLPIERVGRDTPPPASFAQQRLWFLHELTPGSPAYQLHASVRLEGPLDAEVLARTFTEIVRRHEILRTTFAEAGGQLVQVIAGPQPFALPLADLSGLAAEEREAEVRRLATGEALRPFDLRRDPVLRAVLWRLAPEEHVLGLTMHHIASDEWSMNVLVREALQLYESFSAGRPSPLPELPVQYADYAAWQRRWLRGDRLAAELAYWKQQLGRGPYVLELPTDRPRPPVQTSRGAHLPVTVPAGLADALKALGRRQEATLFMVLLAGYKALLHHYAGQGSVIVGTPVADRDRVETEGLIGFFVNMLVLRTDLSGDPTFTELLGRVRETALGAYAHQSLPFDKLVEELKPPRDLSRNPLFQAAFTFDNSAPEERKLSRLRARPLEVEGRATRFDLVLALRETGQGLAGAIQYNADLFNVPRVARMREHFFALLEGVAADPDVRLSELRARLEEADRRHLEEQRQGFRQARSRMLKTARQRPATGPAPKGEAGHETL